MTAGPPSPESVAERFARLLREHGPALRRLAAGYEADQHEREDLLQEIAFALWMALPGFRGDCSERTFLFRIGHNRALTHRRRRRAQPAVLDDGLCRANDHAAALESARRAVSVAERRGHPRLPHYRQWLSAPCSR